MILITGKTPNKQPIPHVIKPPKIVVPVQPSKIRILKIAETRKYVFAEFNSVGMCKSICNFIPYDKKKATLKAAFFNYFKCYFTKLNFSPKLPIQGIGLASPLTAYMMPMI